MANRSSNRESFPPRAHPPSQPRRSPRFIRSRPANQSSSDEEPKLPDELVAEVLKRLPVESLLRCRCVCQSWRSAIDDPLFVALHLSHSALDASNWYLVSLDWRYRLCSLFPSESLALPPLEIPFLGPRRRPDIVGSCDGLICVTQTSINCYRRTMYLWNLFARKHRAVRRSSPGRQFFCEKNPHEALGFGFDVRSKDYKIVRVLYCPPDHPGCSGEAKPRVEIYSLGTDSWRSLECKVPFCGSCPAVFFNGNLHWFVIKSYDPLARTGYGSIVLFDIAREVFDEMALPGEIFCFDKGPAEVSVAVLNDLLAVFVYLTSYRRREPHSICSIWVMREYGTTNPWTKLYTFRTNGPVTALNGFTRNGEVVMEIAGGGERVSWNPITSQFTNVPLSVECDLVTIVESLVSL